MTEWEHTCWRQDFRILLICLIQLNKVKLGDNKKKNKSDIYISDSKALKHLNARQVVFATLNFTSRNLVGAHEGST